MRRAQLLGFAAVRSQRELGIGHLRQEQSCLLPVDQTGSEGVQNSGGTACRVKPHADLDLIAVLCTCSRVCILEGHPCADLIAHPPDGERERHEHRHGRNTNGINF